MNFIDRLIGIISQWILGIISTYGYWGILWSMAVESACIPLPSEIIMTFSGFLVSQGTFNMTLVTLAGASGNLIGSWLAYGAGRFGGRRFLEKYGKYILVSHEEIKKADQWFLRFGDVTVFATRLLPVIRTFISLPAGISKMNFLKFSVYTFIGSIPWCWGLAYAGQQLGTHWNQLGPYFHQFDFLILLALLLFIFWVKRANGRKKTKDLHG
ncbi:MAG: DedA family protein [Nitrospirae bacterium]|nr:DedA family protein [Nitrospirota bacterium]